MLPWVDRPHITMMHVGSLIDCDIGASKNSGFSKNNGFGYIHGCRIRRGGHCALQAHAMMCTHYFCALRSPNTWVTDVCSFFGHQTRVDCRHVSDTPKCTSKQSCCAMCAKRSNRHGLHLEKQHTNNCMVSARYNRVFFEHHHVRRTNVRQSVRQS